MLEVNVSDTVSALLAFPVPSVARATLDSVGCVLSIVTAPDPEVTSTPALPAVSPNVIVYPTVPSWSASATVIAQVQPDASPVAVLGELAIAPLPSVKAQAGAVVTSVLEVNVSDTVSALLAFPAPSVARATLDSVGCVLSIVIPASVEVTAVPALPAVSLNVIE